MIRISNSIHQYRKALIILASLLVAIGAIVTFIVIQKQANALSKDDWRASNIIDDAIFYDNNSMTVQQIQEWMDARLSQCDVNGVQPSEIPGGTDYDGNGVVTRAEYGRTRGYPAPFICLNNYYENPDTRETNLGTNVRPQGSLSAAQIIKQAADTYNVSPKTLLIILRKESAGPLTADNWPFPYQYTNAMGYACPDPPAGQPVVCDPEYAGFYRQMTSAARQFKIYRDNAYTKNAQGKYIYRHQPYNTVPVLFNPNTACGSTNLLMEGYATTALYNYTPYQPNTAALNNLYGTGDDCSAYGNRNFWTMFTNTFGSTHVTQIPGCAEATNTNISCVWNIVTSSGANVYPTSYNDAKYLVDIGGQYRGMVFHVTNPVAPNPGNIPVYNLETSADGGSTFLTTDQNERSVLINSHGYIDKGVAFYADPANSNSGYPVYRLYNASANRHVWTGWTQERQSLLSSGYVDEGVAFTSVSPVYQEKAPDTGKALVYRFYIAGTQSHFWTQDIAERDRMIRAGYSYERVAWQSSTNTADTPVYRLYSLALGKHLYTTDAYERYVLANSGSWRDEGVSQYVSKTANSKPVYRLYSPSTKTHLLSTDAYEKYVLTSNGTWKDEGIAWYQAQ